MISDTDFNQSCRQGRQDIFHCIPNFSALRSDTSLGADDHSTFHQYYTSRSSQSQFHLKYSKEILIGKQPEFTLSDHQKTLTD